MTAARHRLWKITICRGFQERRANLGANLASSAALARQALLRAKTSMGDNRTGVIQRIACFGRSESKQGPGDSRLTLARPDSPAPECWLPSAKHWSAKGCEPNPLKPAQFASLRTWSSDSQDWVLHVAIRSSSPAKPCHSPAATRGVTIARGSVGVIRRRSYRLACFDQTRPRLRSVIAARS